MKDEESGLLGEVELAEDEADGEAGEAANPDEPSPGEPEWTPYVLSLLAEDELVGGRPKAAGLFRLVGRLVGRVVENSAWPCQCPNPGNSFTATVRAKLVVEPHQFGPPTIFTGLADAGDLNTALPYSNYPSATAETRALGRACKKALNLNVLTAEEADPVPSPTQDLISQTMVNFIDMKCRQLGLDVMKFVSMGKAKFERIFDVPTESAVKMIRHLTDVQRGAQKAPDSIKGYDPDWRKAN